MIFLTATKLQTATYLFGVCLFSISFLVFLNSSVSFVVTDIIRREHGIGDAVGTLGFADELVALVACPTAGLLSDRIGVRTVATLGYAIVGISLILFVQAKNVYPQLVIGRMFFSCGGAATATMVTAILPSMTGIRTSKPARNNHENRPTSSSVSSDLTITPARLRGGTQSQGSSRKSSSNRLAGFVGMFTGCGALVALVVFLPLPTWFKQRDISSMDALKDAFYVVGVVALLVACGCFFGLRNLNGEAEKGWRQVWVPAKNPNSVREGKHLLPYWQLALESLKAAGKDPRIGLGYLGGFVARASSVGISLFIPLYVNAYFVNSGICKVESDNPAAVKEQCREAYILAAKLTGVSQLVALISAPIFGFLADRSPHFQVPLVVGALCGIAGYSGLAATESPLTSGDNGSPVIYPIVALLGVSQISAIVCSLGLLSRAIEGVEEPMSGSDGTTTEEQERTQEETDTASTRYESATAAAAAADEQTSLLPSSVQRIDLKHMQGAIAGTYSLLGGAGILILTKLGGYLFDAVSPAWPFILLGIANLMLFAGALVFALVQFMRREQLRTSIAEFEIADSQLD